MLWRSSHDLVQRRVWCHLEERACDRRFAEIVFQHRCCFQRPNLLNGDGLLMKRAAQCHSASRTGVLHPLAFTIGCDEPGLTTMPQHNDRNRTRSTGLASAYGQKMDSLGAMPVRRPIWTATFNHWRTNPSR